MTLPSALAQTLAGVRSVAAITGAGISAESGIPTYRGRGGVYDDPEAGDQLIEALTGQTLARDPDRTWRAIGSLAAHAIDAAPNPGHDALVAIEQSVERFVLLTQNVDGLHQAAGSRNVIDIHGTVSDTLCMGCGAPGTLDDIDGGVVALTAAPRCGCGGVVRPDVVLFGEMLPPAKVARMQREIYASLPDLMLVVGTSAMFPYISEPVVVARAEGRLTVEVNPEPSGLSPIVDHALRGKAGDLLPLIAAAIGDR